MARTPKDQSATVTPREQGPKHVYLVFNAGVTAEFKDQVATALNTVTTNSRMLVRSLTGDAGIGPVIIRELEADKRGPRKTAEAVA